MTGNIPTHIGLNTGLLEIKIEGNAFTGIIPSEFGQIVGLKEMGLGKSFFFMTAWIKIWKNDIFVNMIILIIIMFDVALTVNFAKYRW